MRRILIGVCLVALAFLGVQRLLIAIPWAWPGTALGAAVNTIPLWARLLCWAGAVLLPAGLAAHAIMTGGGRRVLTLEGRGKSELVLRQFVIEKIVRESLSSLPEVDKAQVRATRTGKGLRVEIGLKAKGVHSLLDLENAIRTRAEESLRRILGIEKIEPIRIRLDDMSASRRVHAPEERPAETPLPPPRSALSEFSAPAAGAFWSSPAGDEAPPGEERGIDPAMVFESADDENVAVAPSSTPETSQDEEFGDTAEPSGASGDELGESEGDESDRRENP